MNTIKKETCIKHFKYIKLIDEIGNGVMLQSHIQKIMEHFYVINKREVYKDLKELEHAQIIDKQRLNNVNLIVLKKYAFRHLKEVETGQKVLSKDISSQKITPAKIKRSLWITEYILRSLNGRQDMKELQTTEELFLYLNNKTTLITRKNENIDCFNGFIKDPDINAKVRENVENEISIINNYKFSIIENLKIEGKVSVKEVKDYKKSKEYNKTNFSLNSMVYNNLYITDIRKNQLNITFFDINNNLKVKKICEIVENIFVYFNNNFFTYLENGDLHKDIKIVVQFLVDNDLIKSVLLKEIKEEQQRLTNKGNLTKKERKRLDSILSVTFVFAALNINRDCIKEENFIF